LGTSRGTGHRVGLDDVSAAVLSSLALDQAARIARRMDKAGRLFVRDLALRTAYRRHYAGMERTAAAKAIAADLAVASADEAAPVPTELRHFLDLNNGRPLRWRQLAELLGGRIGWRGW